MEFPKHEEYDAATNEAKAKKAGNKVNCLHLSEV
jgi:hypothetical protein